MALDDLRDIVRYIAHELGSPRAAENLLSKIDKEVKKITDNPFRCRLYSSPEKFKYEYRILNVNNYSVFYVAEKEKIEIHRVIYSKRNILQILKEQKTEGG
ncbi:MAG: type II toxin-antitoxin system RelE/ParE family toxin [Treponema sp.]|nr:type II toxin-antitoxin system RelE/ParE family toxin [Treponema sp.]